jgi:GDP-L-fucose synthase
MRIAVLGAGGFLGKFFCECLRAKNYTVFPITRKDLDLTDFTAVSNWLATLQLDAVVNCAVASNTHIEDRVYDDVTNNLNIFLNFYNNSQYFKKFINIGSGAEYDRSRNIDCADESELLTSNPKDGYGFSKNVISRLALEHNKFHTLRLFGCFHSSEHDFRLFPKVFRGESVTVVDRQFDYMSAQDLFTVLEYYLNNDVEHRDINCVYEEKLYLSQILNKIRPINVAGKDPCNYTGSGKKLAELKLPLLGLDKSIKEYK